MVPLYRPEQRKQKHNIILHVWKQQRCRCCWHEVILTVKSLNTRFLEPRRKAIRAALGWLTSAFCGLGGGGGLLTAAGGDLHINTVKTSVTIINDHKQEWAEEVLHTWKCWGCCLVFAPPVWVQLWALPSNSAYPAKHTL